MFPNNFEVFVALACLGLVVNWSGLPFTLRVQIPNPKHQAKSATKVSRTTGRNFTLGCIDAVLGFQTQQVARQLLAEHQGAAKGTAVLAACVGSYFFACVKKHVKYVYPNMSVCVCVCVKIGGSQKQLAGNPPQTGPNPKLPP